MKCKRGEEAGAREWGTRVAKGGKGRKESGKGKGGKGTAKACFGCQSTDHVVADCVLTQQVMRMRQLDNEAAQHPEGVLGYQQY